ncbi:hypothetical protein BP6252_13615 [Coleophoma cylindrospora]|uniref:Transcriptional activator of proteases prtT n=1 Tax=Coleophoma cylindrospora TaxID=1849047 RepID=A0A3D8Q9S0_9HELO|nr:hypothetical protein BP6252_13615 [Coleophoma cylindrospora]
MPPTRGRASKACLSCRKIKTRCYEPQNTSRGCLRCDRLGQACSLAAEPADHNEVHDHTDCKDRLDALEKTVRELVSRLDPISAASHLSPPLPAPAPPHVACHDTETSTPTAPPVFLIRDAASDIGMGHSSSNDEIPTVSKVHVDVISKGFLTAEQAISLLDLFQEQYGRWVCIQKPENVHALLSETRKSPLLLCACCLIAVRHKSQELATKLAPLLFQEVKGLLSNSLLMIPQSIDFFQAVLILSMWSTTIGQVPMSIDSWLISGYALQQALAAGNLFKSTSSTIHARQPSKTDLDRMCIWNHLCLVHLHYCVGTKRRAVLTREEIDKCGDILGFNHATNFETRMVAEIKLYWIIYESTTAPSIDLPKTQNSLHGWKNEWKHLFAEPRSQFIQMSFRFAQLLIYDHSLKSRSAAVRESSLIEMIRLSTEIINIAMTTADDMTKHLSDHIYHVITFAAITLCRLLNSYESKLSASQNVQDLDSLILSLVTWLHTIGLPSHAAHILGDVVSVSHQKLRPHSHPSPYGTGNPAFDTEMALYFPELLGMESYNIGNSDVYSDWNPDMV